MKHPLVNPTTRLVSQFLLTTLIFLSIGYTQLMADEVVLNGGNGSLTDDTCFNPGAQCDFGTVIFASYWDHAFFRFDLSSINAEIEAATFRVYSLSGNAPAQAVISSGDDDNWDETVTNKTRASFPGAAPTGVNQVLEGFITSTPSTGTGFIEFDVTDFIKAEAAGDGVASLVLSAVSNGGWHSYSPKEGSNSPELVITTADSGNPVASFTATPESGAAPLTVQFADTSTDSGSIASREWDFGDSSAADTTQNPQHVYIDPGVYTVALTVTDDEGNESSTTQEISVNPAGFESGLTGQYFNYVTATPATSPPEFTDLVDSRTDAQIDFDFGTGSPQGIAVGPDTFSVCWKGQIRPKFSETYTFKTSSDDGVELKIDNITVIGQLAIRAELPHPRVHDGQITLTAGQLYDIQLAYFDGPQEASVKLQWESDSQSLEVVPSSRLITDGTAGSCGDGTVANQKPVASFTFSPDPIIANQAFTLDGSASDDADGTVESYSWAVEQIGGGTSQAISPVVNPSSLLSAGNYTITLVVTDNQGLPSDPMVQTVAIGVPVVPSVSINAIPTSGVKPLDVTFTATDADFPAGANLTYSWDFDDGTTGTGATPDHIYTDAGTYTAQVTVSDGTTTATKDVEIIVSEPVNQPPVAVLAVVGDSTGSAPFTLALNAGGSTDDNAVVSYDWSFDDAASTDDDVNTTAATNSHTYATPGTYNVSVTVNDAGSLSDTSATIEITVTVVPNVIPTVTLASSAQQVEEGGSITFTATGADTDGTIASYIWTVGGTADAETGATLTKTFATAGNVTVTVKAVDNDAAESDVVQETITVVQGNAAPVAVDDAIFVLTADTPLTLDVLANDSDANTADTLTVASFDAATTQGGTVTQDATTGALIYTPAAGFTGDDTFTYIANDGSVDSAAATVTITVTDAVQQIVTTDCPDNVRAGAEFTCSVSYNTNNGADTTGLGLRIHFDPAKLEWISFSDVYQPHLVTQDNQPVTGFTNANGANTASLNSAWADQNQNFAWPGAELPVKLYDVTFKLKESAATDDTTDLSFTTQAANGFTAVAVAEQITAGGFTLDIDGNGGVADGFTDGIIIIRYLFGFRGDELITNAIGTGAVLTTSAEIEAYLDANVAKLDVDGDGDQEPLTDGLLILRRMLTFGGNTLIGGIDVAPKTAADIEDAIDALLP